MKSWNAFARLSLAVITLALSSCGVREDADLSTASFDQVVARMQNDINRTRSATNQRNVEEVAAQAIQRLAPNATSVEFSTNSSGGNNARGAYGSGVGPYGTQYSYNRGQYVGPYGTPFGAGSVWAANPNTGARGKAGVIYIPGYGLAAVAGYCGPATSGSPQPCGIAVGAIGSSGAAGGFYCTSLSPNCVVGKNY